MNTAKNGFREGGIIAGRYRIQKCLRGDADKSTYTCLDLKEARKKCILKTINPAGGALKIWSRDFSLLYRLRHPHLSLITDFGSFEKTGALYFVEEWIEGTDIYRGTEGNNTAHILHLLEGLVRTVRSLHARGIVHGSLQPANILLTNAKSRPPHFKLTDSGMTAFQYEICRPEDIRKETLPYTAPELLLGKRPDTASDLYSLGVLAYQALTRQLPFEDADPGFLMQKHLQGGADLRLVERLKGGKSLALWLEGLLEKDSEKRPSSLDESLDLICRAIQNVPSTSTNAEPMDGSLSATRIVGREREMTHLQECAERVRENGRGWTVFVSGEAGLGKTRCLQELKCWGRLQAWRIIEGSCSLQKDVPYSPFRQVLAGARSDRGEEIFHFGESLQGKGSGGFKTSLDYAAGQFQDLLTRELVRYLSECPTLLLLDDFHDADEATSRVLEYLSSDIQAFPVLMCVGFRSGDESDLSLDRVISITQRQNRGEVLNLEPLPGESIEELVAYATGAPALKDTLGTWISGHVGGNPFYIEEMLKHLVDQGVLTSASGRWRFSPEASDQLEAPDSVGSLIRRRFQRLSPRSKEAASWLALIDRPVPQDFLGSLCSFSVSGIPDVLQELGHRHIVRTESQGKEETVEVRHALIAEVIRSRISGKKCRGMHGRIAEELEKDYGGGERLQELARHSMEGRLGEKAVRYALALASRARMEFSHEIAARCFEYALSERTGLDREALCRVAIEYADTMLALGLPKRAIRTLKDEIAASRSINRDLRGRMYMQLALSCQHLGDFAGQEDYCWKGLRLFKNQPLSYKNLTMAMLYAELALGSAIQSHTRRGLALLEKALDTCPNSGAEALSGRIQSIAAFLYRVACNLHQALTSSKQAEIILVQTNECYLACSASSTLGFILMNLGRLVLALERHKHAVNMSDQSRAVIPRAQAMGNLAECLCRMGRIPEALNALEKAKHSAGEAENPAIDHALNIIEAEIRLSDSDYSSAWRILKMINNHSGKSRALYAVGHAYYIVAGLHFTLGDFDTAVDSIRKLRRMQTREAPSYEYELAEALYARILYERGDVQGALRRLRSLDRAVTAKHWPYQMAIIKLHLSEIYTSRGDHETAARYARNAVRLARAMQSAPLESHGRLLLGIQYSNRWRTSLSKDFPENSERRSSQESSELVRTIEELQTCCKLAESSCQREVAWRAHAALCTVYRLLQKEGETLIHAREAYECLCRLEDRTPADMLPAFRDAFGHNRTKSDLARLLESVEGSSSGKGNPVPDGSSAEQSRILSRVSVTVNSNLEPDPLMEAVLDQLIAATGLERALIFLYEGSRQKLRLAKGRTATGESIIDEVALGQWLLEEAGWRGNPVVSANVRTDPRFRGRLSGAAGKGRVLCAPLKVSGRTIGLLYADHSSPVGTLNESAINLFAAFCNLSAIAIDNSIEQRKVAEEKVELERYLHQVREEYAEIVGKSAAVEALRDRIAIVAASPLDVLITGESGTGKELVARAIHRTGRRRGGKFLAVDCGSLTDTLAEAELFGYRKGAFTGAFENRPGLLEAAPCGIIFLDEISNLPFRLQAKFLRVLEEREVRRVGETVTRRIDIQVIAATNRDLPAEIEAGRFREDLYYRLKKMDVRMPPLRERLDDVPLLAGYFLHRTAENEHGRLKRFSSQAMALMKRYSYPGNIRELLNVVSASYYSTSGPIIDVRDLPQEVRSCHAESSGSDSELAGKLYRDILKGNGSFNDRIKIPFLKHRFGAAVVQEVVRKALTDSRGRYRDAFERLGIPGDSYASTMQFLKRHGCYLDFRAFRKKRTGDENRTP